MGLTVGYVRNLKSKDNSINVEILITRKDMKIPNGTSARVEFYGLGASKSIELMPPEGSCDVGILTSKTIRLNDVVHETESLVEIVEMAEKYVKGIDKTGLKKLLEDIESFKSDNIKNLGNSFTDLNKEMSKRFDEIRFKQKGVDDKIQKMNTNMEKINNFIKR